MEDIVLRNFQLENLRKAMEKLDQEDQDLLTFRYDGKLTLEEIGKVYGVSKMAVSKRLRKLHERGVMAAGRGGILRAMILRLESESPKTS